MYLDVRKRTVSAMETVYTSRVARSVGNCSPEVMQLRGGWSTTGSSRVLELEDAVNRGGESRQGRGSLRRGSDAS